jgi:hypothetical protein
VRETVGQEQGLSLRFRPQLASQFAFLDDFYFYLLFPDVHNVLSAVTVEKKESHKESSSVLVRSRAWGPHRSKMPVIVIVIGSCSAGREMITRGANQ